MKKHLRILFPLLLGLLVAISAVSIERISDIRDYGKLINYVGIVRGASQRVVKLETNGRPDDELIGYVDDILDELVTGRGVYGLVSTDCKLYQVNLNLLKGQWETVREEIDAVRQGESADLLIDSSERLFEIANNTVFCHRAVFQRYGGKDSAHDFGNCAGQRHRFCFCHVFLHKKILSIKGYKRKAGGFGVQR